MASKHIIINRIFFLFTLVFLVGCSSLPVVLDYHQRIDPITMGAMTADKIVPKVVSVNGVYPTISNIIDGARPVIDLYRQDVTHESVVSFFTELSGSKEIAIAILRHAERTGVPALLSFSLAWGESRFDIYAKNYNSSSSDRGLFQLNSLSFFWLSEDDFLDPDVNAHYAHNYYAACLKKSKGDYKMAWAMYNAGMGRVLRGVIPQSTQAYVIKLAAYYQKLEQQYKKYILETFPTTIAEVS